VAPGGRGGLVDMHQAVGSLVREGDPVCTITNPFKTDTDVVEAPFTGLLVGTLENPLVSPGNPLCHLVRLDERTRRAVGRSQGSPPPRASAAEEGSSS